MWCCTTLLSYFFIWIWLTLKCLEFSYCTTGLWTPWFQHENGSYLIFCLLCLFCSRYAVSCFVRFSTSGILIHIPVFGSHIWICSGQLVLCSNMHLRREGCVLAYYHRFVTPSGESYLYLARKLLEGWQKHNSRSKWLLDVKSSPIVQRMTTERNGQILGGRLPKRGFRNATSSVDYANVIRLQFNLLDTLHPLKSCWKSYNPSRLFS